MMLPLTIAFFVLSAHVIAADISYVDDLSYEDLRKMKSCDPLDTCDGAKRSEIYPEGTYPNTCSCHHMCAELGVCCIDSPQRGRSPATHKCFAVEHPRTYIWSTAYYMVQSCPEDNVWKPLCEGGLDKDGDILRIAPVSSLHTKTTYKNYYCFRCNERTDNFLYWNLFIQSFFNGTPPVKDDYKVTYDDLRSTWSAAAVDRDFSIEVRLQFDIPPGVTFHVHKCKPSMVADCPDSWKDDDVRSKCHSYMALLYKPFGPIYKNAHCALCNSQPLNELVCRVDYHIPEHSFTFAHLIDVNMGDDKKSKCADGEVWDGYGKKCQKLSCALPGYVIKDGECIAP